MENKTINNFLFGLVAGLSLVWIWTGLQSSKSKPIEEMTKSELQKVLAKLVKQENYEMAAVVRDTIKKLE